MRLIKKISIPFLTAVFLIAGFSCAMEEGSNWNDNEKYVTAHLTIGGTVYYDDGEAEPQNVEGLKVRIIGTSGTTETNQHGYFIINTTKVINRQDLEESIVIEVSDYDGNAAGGPYATKSVTLNIGRLLVVGEAAGDFVAKNDASELNIYVDRINE